MLQYDLGRFWKFSKSTPKSRFSGSETSFWALAGRPLAGNITPERRLWREMGPICRSIIISAAPYVIGLFRQRRFAYWGGVYCIRWIICGLGAERFTIYLTAHRLRALLLRRLLRRGRRAALGLRLARLLGLQSDAVLLLLPLRFLVWYIYAYTPQIFKIPGTPLGGRPGP